MSVEILLATFNREDFLRLLLDSLLAQTFQDWKILARDDGSTDGSLDVLSEFQEKHPGRILILRDSPDAPNANLGAFGNYNRLLAHSTAPYVMFCDDDDLWPSKKIERSMEAMHDLERKYGNTSPLLIHSDISVIDSEGNSIMDSFNRRLCVHKEKTSLSHLLVQGVVTGSTMMMNRSLVDKSIPLPKKIMGQDLWCALVASGTGHIGYIDEPLLQYRAHQTNMGGINIVYQKMPSVTSDQKPWRIWSEGMRARITKIEENLDGKLAQAAAYSERYRSELNENDRAALDAFLALPRQDIWKRRVSIIQHGLLPHPLKASAAMLLFCGRIKGRNGGPGTS